MLLHLSLGLLLNITQLKSQLLALLKQDFFVHVILSQDVLWVTLSM